VAAAAASWSAARSPAPSSPPPPQPRSSRSITPSTTPRRGSLAGDGGGDAAVDPVRAAYFTPPRGGAGGRQERVQVTVRVRPTLPDMPERGGAIDVYPDGRGLRVNRHLAKRSHIEHSDLAFDTVLPPAATQEDVYQSGAKSVVDDVVQGYNGTVMAYGQTGAGKTYTVGNMLSTSGIIPRAAAELFDARDRDPEHDFKLYMSYVQARRRSRGAPRSSVPIPDRETPLFPTDPPSFLLLPRRSTASRFRIYSNPTRRVPACSCARTRPAASSFRASKRSRCAT